jgi:diadenosine tetraphosphate (Ap4A) HIT family hydrolase
MQLTDLDSRLVADCHHLGSLGAAELLLNRNAILPWFILVPHTEEQDLLDLEPQLRDAVIASCANISAFIKTELGFEKVNFAGLGNVVAQMHLHIVGRREGDACWPQPVWGNLESTEAYSRDTLLQWQDKLVEQIGLLAADLES